MGHLRCQGGSCPPLPPPPSGYGPDILNEIIIRNLRSYYLYIPSSSEHKITHLLFTVASIVKVKGNPKVMTKVTEVIKKKISY